jgi:2-dehydro-3-deoxygluconokinase
MTIAGRHALYRRTGLFSKEYLIHIVDRVGGGDSFGGGLIHSLARARFCAADDRIRGAASC